MQYFFLISFMVALTASIYGFIVTISTMGEEKIELRMRVAKAKEDNDREIYLYLRSIGKEQRFFDN